MELPGPTLRAVRPISVQRCANLDAHLEDAFVPSLAFRPRRGHLARPPGSLGGVTVRPDTGPGAKSGGAFAVAVPLDRLKVLTRKSVRDGRETTQQHLVQGPRL